MSSGALPRKEEKKNEIHLDKGSATGDEKQKKTERKMKYISTGALPRGGEKQKKTVQHFNRGSAPGGRKTEGKKSGKHFARGSAPGEESNPQRLIRTVR